MAKTPMSLFDVDVTKFLSGTSIPSINFEAAMASQRKNFEALAQANKLALEGAQVFARRQGEMMSEGAEVFSGALNKLVSAGSFEDQAVKQAEFAKTAYQKALANFWELGELVNKSNSRTFGIINKRVTDTLDEVKTVVSAGPSGE
ncbi:MAG: phasin family protein [Alphaproteobacteria bacterium]